MSATITQVLRHAREHGLSELDFRCLLATDPVSLAFQASLRDVDARLLAEDGAQLRALERYFLQRVRQRALWEELASSSAPDAADAELLRREAPPLAPAVWAAYESAALQTLQFFYRNKRAPGLFRELDALVPFLDPSICLQCGRDRYVLFGDEGCFLCNNPHCRHQVLQLVESRVSCGTGYSNELCILQGKSVITQGAAQVLVLRPPASSSSSASVSPAFPGPSATTAVFGSAPTVVCQQQTSQASERLQHFRELLEPFRGTIRAGVPRHVVQAVVQKLTERRVVLSQDLRYATVRALLKETGYNQYMGRTHTVMQILGHAMPYMTDETEELLCHLFQKVEQLWQRFCGDAKSLCFQYHFMLQQLCIYTGHREFLPYIPVCKDGSKQTLYEDVLRRVLQVLQSPSVWVEADGEAPSPSKKTRLSGPLSVGDATTTAETE